MLHELFGQRDHRQLAGATAIILGLASALENTIGIVVGGRAGRNSSPSRLMRLGLQLLCHRPSLGDCLPSAGRIWTLDGRADMGATSCAWNGAARATRRAGDE